MFFILSHFIWNSPYNPYNWQKNALLYDYKYLSRGFLTPTLLFIIRMWYNIDILNMVGDLYAKCGREKPS